MTMARRISKRQQRTRVLERDLKEAGAGQPMSAHSQRRAIRALQNFLAPVAPKNAPAEKSTREENITDPCRRDVRQASDELSGELSNGIVKCYLGLAIRAVIGAVVGPLDNSINDIKAANAYTRSEMDNVQAILTLLDTSGITLPHLLPTDRGLRGKLENSVQGKCILRAYDDSLRNDEEEDMDSVLAARIRGCERLQVQRL